MQIFTRRKEEKRKMERIKKQKEDWWKKLKMIGHQDVVYILRTLGPGGCKETPGNKFPLKPIHNPPSKS